MGVLLRVIVNALGLWVAAWLLPRMDVHAPEAGTGEPTAGTLIA